MKKIIALFLLILLTVNAFAQNINQSNVPAVVLNTFQLKFPNADDVNWKLDKGNYKINFKLNSKSSTLKMDFKGTVLEQVLKLYSSELPKSTLATIRSKIPSFDIDKAEKHEKGDKVYYEVLLKNEGKNNFFWINDKGKLLKYRRELKDNEIPSLILKNINDQFGTFEISRSKYVEDNGNTNYIVRGDINGMEHAFWFSNKAVLLRHVQDLRKSEIPNLVLNAVLATYNDYEINDAEFIEEKGKTSYVVVLKKSSKKVSVTLSAAGKIMKTR